MRVMRTHSRVLTTATSVEYFHSLPMIAIVKNDRLLDAQSAMSERVPPADAHDHW